MIEIKSSKQLLEKIQIKRTEHKSSKYFQAKFHQFRKSSDPKTLESNNLKINESKNPLDMKFSYQTTLQNLIIFCLFDFGYLPKTVQRMFLEIDFIYSASKILWELIVIYFTSISAPSFGTAVLSPNGARKKKHFCWGTLNFKCLTWRDKNSRVSDKSMEGDMSWYRRRLIYLSCHFFEIRHKSVEWKHTLGPDQMEKFSRIHLIRAVVVHETDCEILDWLENAGISH